MKRIARTVLVLALSLSLSGCLGTIVQAPGQQGRSYKATNAHLILAPRMVDARDCEKGMQEVTVSVPLWGVVVGFLTFGILIPVNTTVTCVR